MKKELQFLSFIYIFLLLKAITISALLFATFYLNKSIANEMHRRDRESEIENGQKANIEFQKEKRKLKKSIFNSCDDRVTKELQCNPFVFPMHL